jgi:hypothetical protein
MNGNLPNNQKLLWWTRLVVGMAGVVTGWSVYPTGRIVPADRAVPLALIVVGAIVGAHAGLDLLWAKLWARDAPSSSARTPEVVIPERATAVPGATGVTQGTGTGTATGTAQDTGTATGTAQDTGTATGTGQSTGTGDAVTQDTGTGAQTAVGAFVAAMTTVLGLLAVFSTSPTFAIRLGALILVIGVIVGLMVLLFVANGIGGLATRSMIAWIVSILFSAAAFGLACIGLAVFFR